MANQGKPSPSFYSSANVGSVRSSTDLTTLGSEPITSNKKFKPAELTKRIKQYSHGSMSKNEFLSYLETHDVPRTPELERKIREHETTQSINYHQLGKIIFKNLSETPRLTGKPNEKDPSAFVFLNCSPPPKTSEESKEKMRQESLRQELDKLGVGVYSGHKRKIKPPVEDKQHLTAWKPEEARPYTTGTHDRQQRHHDIFSNSSATSSGVAPRKLKIEARAASDSGNILAWSS